MSEQKKGFMAELDDWIQAEIFDPIEGVCWASITDSERMEIQGAIIPVIRQKILESYRNGQEAGPRKVFKR